MEEATDQAELNMNIDQAELNMNIDEATDQAELNIDEATDQAELNMNIDQAELNIVEATDQAELNIDEAKDQAELNIDEAKDQATLNIDGSSPIPVDQDLVGVSVSNVDEAYELYNDYAYRVGFSVRKGKQCYKGSTKTVKMKKFLCSKAGHKVKVHGVKSYSKMDLRTGCGASVQFDVDGNGVWTVTKHEKGHNHELCPSDKSHLLRSHRRVVKNQFLCLNDLKSEVALADDIRLLKQQSEGSPSVGVASSIWAVEMTRKFQRLIVSCQDNNVARQICEEAFENAKRRIEAEVGCVHIEEFVVSSSNDIV
ncbi:PREDICTED: protein FAR1-RELATED SEQUENCE 11-like isoform X2 [Ipomoea nil]|uniref:protein FAR1-RELATED SEQUENCE 11-like isoform X2 n=1 Tax=Ipomoea nil TaxID=35883 RepID=UPI0009016DF1|nr:PREDICTED: protein FAR1-RELATED SEQUENCE 11-like isoform X2 [Ipomoea nil]